MSLRAWIAFGLLCAALTVLAAFMTLHVVESKLPGPVVKISAEKGHGSGVSIGNGYVLTAAHVIPRGTTEMTALFDNGEEHTAEVVWSSQAHDIALMRLPEDAEIESATLSCRSLSPGERLIARGNPMNLEHVATHGYVAGTVKSHRDIVKGMSKAMGTMGYYLVMAFFAALFTYAFRESNIGALLAIKGANSLKALALPGPVTIIGIILLTTLVNLLIGSASAKWALLAPVFVPMLMRVGYSPEVIQAAYRIGDSSTNIR